MMMMRMMQNCHLIAHFLHVPRNGVHGQIHGLHVLAGAAADAQAVLVKHARLDLLLQVPHDHVPRRDGKMAILDGDLATCARM